MHHFNPKPRPAAAAGSEQVNIILSRYVAQQKIPDPVGDLSPSHVVAIWAEHGEPIQDGYIVFDMRWLLH